MSVRSGFFNSLNNDRLYNAEDMSNYYEGLVSNGVYYTVGDALAVTAGTDPLTVNVGSGRAMIDCRWLRNSSDLTLSIDAAGSSSSRIDSVVVKLDLDARDMTIEVVKGGNTAPALEDTATVKYLRLADVTAIQGTQSISVLDCRGSTDCPWVKAVTPSSSIVYYDNVMTMSTTAEGNTLPVNIPEYEPSIDMLEVRLNGISLNPNEYEVSGSGSLAAVTFLNGIESGNEVWFRVVKSLDFQLSQVVNAEEES